MPSRFKGTPPRMVAVCYSLMLALLLVACGGGTTSAPTPTPTPPALTHAGSHGLSGHWVLDRLSQGLDGHSG
jgi:hypothetical protein